MSLDFAKDKSTLVQVMAWCRQATSHYLSQCWPRSLSPYSVSRPQWVKANQSINQSGVFQFCYVSVALSKDHVLLWIQQLKSILWQCCRYFNILKVSGHHKPFLKVNSRSILKVSGHHRLILKVNSRSILKVSGHHRPILKVSNGSILKVSGHHRPILKVNSRSILKVSAKPKGGQPFVF